MAGTDVEHRQRRVKRNRSVGNGDRMRGAGHDRAERLEPRDHRPLREVTAAQHREDETFHLGTELRCGDPDASLHRDVGRAS